MTIQPKKTMESQDVFLPLPSIKQQLTRDTLAGVITGVMAIPLSAGICLMSDYPVMSGLYTVMLAGIVSFCISLFRPGNHTGMPGIAAGLAPALALGVATFGMENMPFVILLTALFQAFVWYKGWEKYLLQLVPAYLVEGLLAGVGLKIMLKFMPEMSVGGFAKEGIVLGSLALFFVLYAKFKKSIPALPYIIIMVLGIGSTYLFEFHKLILTDVPFSLGLPLPHFEHANNASFLMLLKMIGFALMLATIDIIEQVMSHVAIVKLDEFKRPHNVNNGLLAIWMANLISTSFGGMTNLDGLAKSTTNTVAGAVTKRSNLITAIFIFGVIMLPSIIEALPLYTLSIIMIYSGFSMITKLQHVWHEGYYPMTLSSLCAVMVYSLGIFEGLLLVLLIHGCIQMVSLSRSGMKFGEQFSLFKTKLKT